MMEVSEVRIAEYIKYHKVSQEIGDIDPSYNLLKYIADRFELNTEQRYWLCFLYATCYNASTVYYIYNEFPDYLGVDPGRLQRWWDENRDKVVFTTDCRWIRSNNQFVDVFRSYRSLAGEFQAVTIGTVGGFDTGPMMRYDLLYKYFSNVYQFGRFKLFLLLEAMKVVCDLNIEPSGLPLIEAASSRNGLAYAIGADHLITGDDEGQRTSLALPELRDLDDAYHKLKSRMANEMPGIRIDAWNTETTLCAYKKYKRNGQRWPGYYITRQGKEIAQMSNNVQFGVSWQPLWDFRTETYPTNLLWEFTGSDNNGAVWPKV